APFIQDVKITQNRIDIQQPSIGSMISNVPGTPGTSATPVTAGGQTTAGTPGTGGTPANQSTDPGINNYPKMPPQDDGLYQKPGVNVTPVMTNDIPDQAAPAAPEFDNNIYPEDPSNAQVSAEAAKAQGLVSDPSTLTLVSTNAVTVDLVDSLKELKHVFPDAASQSLDRIVSTMDAYLQDFENMKNGNATKKLAKLPTKESSVDQYFVIETTGLNGQTVSMVPMRKGDLDALNMEVANLTNEIGSLNAHYKGINPEDYKPGQQLSIEDLARVQLANVGYQLKSISEGVSPDMSYPEFSFGNFKGTKILGTSPHLAGNSGDEGYTPDQGSIMMSAMPTVMLEYHANKMRDIYMNYEKDVRQNGYRRQKEIAVKTEMLKQAALMKRITSQCMMVAEDKEFFGMGEKVFTAGTGKILGEAGVVNALDANLDMFAQALKTGWPLSDADTLGSMAFYARSLKKLENVTYVSPAGKRKIGEFTELVDSMVDPEKLKHLGEITVNQRYEMLEQAQKLIKELPDEAKEYEFTDMFNAVSGKIDDALEANVKKADLGVVGSNWHSIKMESFSQKDFAELKARTTEAMQTASTTLQAKCLAGRGENEKAVTRNESLKAFNSLLDKHDSTFHINSGQFKEIKTGLKKVTGGKGTAQDVEKLKEDVKKWLTDPKYDRINKHGKNSFDNKRFNDMYALANELDPKWAKDHFKEMKLNLHHGDTKSAFSDMNALLDNEHKKIVDKGCLVNSETQKTKAWYTGKAAPGKASAPVHDSKNVKKTSLKDLEKSGGNKKAEKTGKRKSAQRSASKNGASHSM
ncbi:MAG: hypothetical protein J5966_01070, partial [Lachnospiraceae bacterium]|nr:hypothetical protein [Lachnospiraceae bacterium]